MAAACAGVRVEDGLEGRVLVAARAFAAGDIVLEEVPTLQWRKDAPGELVSAFLSASPVDQASILSMATDTEDGSERARERHLLAQELAEIYQGPRVLELIETLLSICDTNAHSFESGLGLFAIACKASHSCDPNCGHSTRIGGSMRYYAFRPIAEGQQITISYISDLWSTSRAERRARLLAEKSFECACCRCSGPDEIDGLSRQARLVAAASAHPSAAAITCAFSSLECAAASCNSTATACKGAAVAAHLPTPSLVVQAVSAFLACCADCEAPAASKALAATISARYLPWARLQFGTGDRAVLAMEAALTEAARATAVVVAAELMTAELMTAEPMAAVAAAASNSDDASSETI